MLPFSPEPSVFQGAKCFFSHGILGHVDPAQPPTIESTPQPAALSARNGGDTRSGPAARLRKPWASLQALGFVSQLDLVLPASSVDAVERTLAAQALARSATAAQPRYARVTMTLGQVLDGAFFETYVKAGNIMMLSQGRPSQDNVFTLKDGRLTLFLEKETYERAGLEGKPHGVKGSRGMRPRWIVEFDLHAKAMRRGKAGFDRLLYACQNVLDAPVQWLFCNMFDPPTPDPLSEYSPRFTDVAPTVETHGGIALAHLGRPASLLHVDDDRDEGRDARVEAEEAAVELYEWLSLVRLGSPRVQSADNMDPYLSRYRVPIAGEDDDKSPAPSADVCTLRWRGLLSPTWACQVLLDVLVAASSSSSAAAAAAAAPNVPWFALSASGFASSKGLGGDGAECMFFRPADAPSEFLLWDVHAHE